MPQAETLVYAQDLLDRGLAFNAHEVLEAAWKNGPDDEAMLWQGLAQLAVGITHVQRGNVKGAVTLLRRASARISHADRPAPHAIDAAGLVSYADALIDDLIAGTEISQDAPATAVCSCYCYETGRSYCLSGIRLDFARGARSGQHFRACRQRLSPWCDAVDLDLDADAQHRSDQHDHAQDGRFGKRRLGCNGLDDSAATSNSRPRRMAPPSEFRSVLNARPPSRFAAM